MTAEGFVYDAFVSYRHQEPDKSWVRRTLVPHLDAAGLRVCLDHRDFRLGVPIVTEMARAVEQSRYTIAVLSPTYLVSTFTELENVLAEHLGLERAERRLLLIRREPCEPPLRLRARLMLEMTDETEIEDGLSRLVTEMRQPAAPHG